jgi:hypothetical protein
LPQSARVQFEPATYERDPSGVRVKVRLRVFTSQSLNAETVLAAVDSALAEKGVGVRRAV